MRWKRIQTQSAQFWRRWQNEYLQHLRCLSKWTKKQPNVQLGQIVLIGDDNNPVAKWPMGIVIHTQKGADGIVRVATVRVGSNIYKRNVRLLAPLPIEISALNYSTCEPSTEQLRENNHDSSPLITVRNNWSDRLRSKGGENGSN